jgi:hypothetical protein
VSFREWITRLLNSGEVREPSPDAIVELDDVWLTEGPRLLQVLENAAIKASGVESTNIATEATATTRMRLFVRFADLSRATAVLEDHRRQLRSTN